MPVVIDRLLLSSSSSTAITSNSIGLCAQFNAAITARIYNWTVEGARGLPRCDLRFLLLGQIFITAADLDTNFFFGAGDAVPYLKWPTAWSYDSDFWDTRLRSRLVGSHNANLLYRFRYGQHRRRVPPRRRFAL